MRDRPADGDGLVRAFLFAPLYSMAYARAFGTLYTALYRPHTGATEIFWPDFTWRQSFAAFAEGSRRVLYPDVDGAPAATYS